MRKDLRNVFNTEIKANELHGERFYSVKSKENTPQYWIFSVSSEIVLEPKNASHIPVYPKKKYYTNELIHIIFSYISFFLSISWSLFIVNW